MLTNIQRQPSLVEVLQAVEARGDELVNGCCSGDVRDAVVLLSNRLSKLKGLQSRHYAPIWTLRDQWALDVMLRAFGRLMVEHQNGRTPG